MNRAAKFFVVAFTLSVGLGQTTYASNLGFGRQVSIEQALRSFDGGFNIEHVYNWHGLPDRRDGPRSAPVRTETEMNDIRASIAENESLSRKLADQGVALKNIANVQKALNGSVTFYVR
ncbi:hypothetical protein [Oryzifoliimicrobium ureilyticus]|uniref:hypothetical protein n=1 Tax=Oryzifoliimicrobium ureilyticus TaxID=3113724 RepID=UPI003075F824